MQSQTSEYSSMVKKHTNEMHMMRKQHLVDRTDLLRRLLLDAHKDQVASLKERNERFERILSLLFITKPFLQRQKGVTFDADEEFDGGEQAHPTGQDNQEQARQGTTH